MQKIVTLHVTGEVLQFFYTPEEWNYLEITFRKGSVQDRSKQ